MRQHPGDPPACVECLWYSPDNVSSSQCMSDDCSVYNPVLGRQPQSTQAARRENGPCGLTAKFFSPKPEPTWFERNFGKIMWAIAGVSIALFVTKGWLWG